MTKTAARGGLQLLLVAMTVLLVVSAEVLAQFPEPYGVDLIILIDQSGSMSGTRKHAATDSGGVRVSTAQYLMEYLHFDGAYVNTERVNRVTVIGFGSPDKTHSMVALAPLETTEDVERAQSGIVAENLGNTSFINALRLVREQFPPETDDEPRQRIIVIVTDGGPYDERAERNVDPFTYGDYFSEIHDYYNTELGAEQFPLYVICVDKTNLYWSNVVRYWENTAGASHAIRVPEIEEANREIVRLLCPLLNPDQPPEYCALLDLGPHFVQPYAHTVQFSFFKYDPTAQARLYRPGDYPDTYVKPSDPDVDFQATQTDSDTRDEIYRISNPSVGCWLTDREGTGQVDVFVQVVFHLMGIVSPTSAHPQILPLTIELELLDDQGQPVDEFPDYPIMLSTNLIGESGNDHPIQVHRVDVGQYATVSPLMLTEPGFYTLTMEGHTTVVPSPLASCITSTQNIPIFQRQTFQIFVSEPRLAVLSPGQPHVHYGPITDMTLGFTDPDGNPIPVPQDVPWAMHISAQAPSGELVDLPDPQWENGHFRVTDSFLLPESGAYALTARLVDGTGAQVFEYETTFTTTENIRVLTPGANYPAFAPVGMAEVELRDANDQPVAVDPNYPLNLIMEVTRPDGTSEQAALSPASEPGHYRCPVNWVFDTAAPHSLDLLGHVKLLPGQPEQLAFVAHREVNVSPILPYFRVVSPDETQSDSTYPLHRWFLPPFPFALRSMPIRVDLWHGTQPVAASEFFITDPNQLFTLKMSGPGTQTLTIPLLDVSGTGQVFGTDLSELTEPGAYTATFKLDGAIRGNVPTEGAWPERAVNFQLEDPTIYPVAWWTGIVAVSLTVLALAGWQLLNRMILTPVRGELFMETVSGGNITSVPLTGKRRNRMKIKGKSLGNLVQLKDIRIRRADPLEKRKAGRSESIEGIDIVARTVKGEEIRGELYAERVLGRNNILKKPAMKTRDGERYQFRYEN
jgi:hypothetical protein